MRRKSIILFPLLLGLLSCGNAGGNEEAGAEKRPNAYVESFSINGTEIANRGRLNGVDPTSVTATIVFSEDIDVTDLSEYDIYVNLGVGNDFTILESPDSRTLVLELNPVLKDFTTYEFYVTDGEYLGLNLIDSNTYYIVTQMDETPKFPEIDDEELLDLVQEKTFAYFWDYAHPVSGLARERYGSGDTVTSGGSGFGIMTIPVAIERGFITREEGVQRLLTITGFLLNEAETFHGAYSHWLNGSTGEAIPFSSADNGGDLVETAFLIQGLLTVREYFDGASQNEQTIRDNITAIWERVEWSWYTRNGAEDVLYWHWSPDYEWQMNMPIRGWNEGLIVYVLAASSPTHPVDKAVYDSGWAQDGSMRNGREFYGVTLPLGSDYGGPLFFAHYSFLGLDPRNLSDAYADYWEQNVSHSKINFEYCKANPAGHYGYSENCWGLTACDIPDGYTANSPTNDTGTIAPTAALSSFPYTPDESMAALHYFYYILGDRLFGDYGFRDSFNLDRSWFASSYIAIDQGPIVIMIENYRTGLLWKLFMQNEEVLAGLAKLGFEY